MMVRLLVLCMLFSSLAACGSDSNIEGDHTSVKVTYKDMRNVVYGTFIVPPGQSIRKVQLFYDDSVTNPVLTASPCQLSSGASAESGLGLLTAPSALFCSDNSFYFSGLISEVSVARATLSDNSYLYLNFSSYMSSADVSIQSQDDWHNEDGTSIEID